MVNALQRCSTLVVQNSLREGFGLTVAEAMWKARPVMGTGACGIRAQVSDGNDGRLVADPLDVDAVAHTLGEMLADDKQREVWARNARDRVGRDGLVFREAGEWLKLLASVASRS
jgi:trehalose synthase